MANVYHEELELLDDTYTDIVEAIMNKPDLEDYEQSRIYFENLMVHMNKWVANIKEVKNNLEAKEPIKDISADNRPA